MKNHLRVFFFAIALVSFGLAIDASIASEQDMPGMNMPKAKPKPKMKRASKPKPKAKAKPVSRPKPTTAAEPPVKTVLAKPAAKPADINMPMDMPMPSSTPKPTPMPMDIPMPGPSPFPSPARMDMQMPSPTLNPTPTPTPTPMPMQMDMPMPQATPTLTPKPMDMDMPIPSPSPTPKPSPAGVRTKELPNPTSEEDFGEPVADSERYGSTLFDVFEFRPGRGGDSDFRWDITGWYGGDYNRFFYKSEGEHSALRAEYDIDLQLLYGRLISPFFTFQAGVRFETHSFRGANVTRPQAVVGFEGLAPYIIELETGVFIDPKGNVSGRLSLTKDFLFTNRLVMQARVETNAAIQQVERFATGRGLNNIEAGFRFRYELRRKFAPYVGITFDRSFFGTADLVRQEGGSPGKVRLAMGVRLFF